MDASDVIQILREAVPGAQITEVPAIDMPSITVDRMDIVAVCRALRDHSSLQFALLADLTAADYFPVEPRFEIVYHLACLGEAYATGAAAPPRRLRMKVRLAGDAARIPSVVSIFPAAGWLEREVFDLFGVAFEGHPDLRRLLTPEDWTGHPLRKDYPVQIRKDTPAWSPVQLSVEEFAANIRAERDRAATESQAAPPGPSRAD